MKDHFQKRGALIVCAVLLAAVLAACGGPASVNVTMTDYQMELSADSVAAGEVTFKIQNASEMTIHEFVVVQSDLQATEIPVGEDLLVDESLFTPVDEVEDIPAGESAELTVTLTPGHYVLLCNIAGHYQLGMHADFNVTP